MKSFTTRTTSALLMLAVALSFATTGFAITTASYKMLAGVSGISYFWTVVSELMTTNTTVATQINTSLQSDLQAAAGMDVTVTYTGMLINASAMYLEYTATVPGSSPTEEELQARVAADATFPMLTAVLSSQFGASDIADLIPMHLYVTNPLYADPAASNATTEHTVVSSVDYGVVVLFSGTPSAWTSVLESARSTVTAEIVGAVGTLMNTSKLLNDVTVNEMYVLAADSEKKSMGSGAGGLVARLSVTASARNAMTGRYLSTIEYASVLLALDTTALAATFQASSGSAAAVVVEETTTVAALGMGEKCDSSCKGMIAMAAAIVFLAIVCVVMTTVAIVCPCYCLRAPRDPRADQSKKKYVVQTNVEQAINVYGDEELVESRQPTTVAASPRYASREPIVG